MSEYGVVITVHNDDEQQTTTTLLLDTLEDDNITSSSTITRHPIVTGDLVADHMYRNPDTLTLRGIFSLNGSKGIVVVEGDNKLNKIQDLFEDIKNKGLLCDITRVKIESDDSGKQSPVFKSRKNMILSNISWTQGINDVNYTFTFNEALIMSVDFVPPTSDDNFNPNISDFVKSTFTDSLFDVEIVKNLTVQILKEQNLIDEKALNNFTKKSTILIVGGLFTPFGIGTIASGIAYAVGKSKFENKRRVKAFRYYQNSNKNEKEAKRFNDMINDIYKQFKIFNEHILVYQVSKDEDQETILQIGSEVYVFKFTKSNVNKSACQLQILDGDDNQVGVISNLSSAPDNILALSTTPPILTVDNNQVFIVCDKEDEKEKQKLTNYYILVSDIDFKKFNNMVVEIINKYLLVD